MKENNAAANKKDAPKDGTSKPDNPRKSKKDRKGKKSKSSRKDGSSRNKPTLAQKAFPMVAIIDEQIRTTIPPEYVERVKQAKSRKQIISSVYPYKRMMDKDAYEKEIALLQIELVKMQTWV